MEGVGLGAKAAGSRARRGEVPRESRSEERAEDEVGTLEGGEGEPQKENKLEEIVEREPVYNADKALNNSEEREDNPVGQPLGIIVLVMGKQGVERIVSRDDETGNVGEELAAEVKQDEEEVERDRANNGVGLGDRGLFLEVVESRVLGELFVELSDVLLNTVLGVRHCCEEYEALDIRLMKIVDGEALKNARCSNREDKEETWEV